MEAKRYSVDCLMALIKAFAIEAVECGFLEEARILIDMQDGAYDLMSSDLGDVETKVGQPIR